MKKCVYMHKFPNGKIYIGQTNNCKRRWEEGRNYQQKAMKEAIKKYGWNNVEHIILEDNIDVEKIDERENYYIGKYKSYKNEIGYNTVYNNKYYKKYKYSYNQKIKLQKKNKIIKITLYNDDYDYFEKEASKYYMKVEDYIYIKLMEQKNNITFLELQ